MRNTLTQNGVTLLDMLGISTRSGSPNYGPRGRIGFIRSSGPRRHFANNEKII